MKSFMRKIIIGQLCIYFMLGMAVVGGFKVVNILFPVANGRIEVDITYRLDENGTTHVVDRRLISKELVDQTFRW